MQCFENFEGGKCPLLVARLSLSEIRLACASCF